MNYKEKDALFLALLIADESEISSLFSERKFSESFINSVFPTLCKKIMHGRNFIVEEIFKYYKIRRVYINSGLRNAALNNEKEIVLFLLNKGAKIDKGTFVQIKNNKKLKDIWEIFENHRKIEILRKQGLI